MLAEGGYEVEQEQENSSAPVYATPDEGEPDYSDYNAMQGSGAGAGSTAAGEYKILHPVHATAELVYADQEALGRDRKDTV